MSGWYGDPCIVFYQLIGVHLEFGKWLMNSGHAEEAGSAQQGHWFRVCCPRFLLE